MDEKDLMEAQEACPLSKAENASAVHVTTQTLLDKPIHDRHRRSVHVGISYFTRKAEQDKLRRLIAARRLSLENMSDAHRHFEKKSRERTEPKVSTVGRMINAMSMYPAAMGRSAAYGGESQANNNKAEPEKSLGAPHPAAIKSFPAKEMKERFDALEMLESAESTESIEVSICGSVNQTLQDQADDLHGHSVPVAISYFAKKAEEDEARRLAEARGSVPFAVS